MRRGSLGHGLRRSRSAFRAAGLAAALFVAALVAMLVVSTAELHALRGDLLGEVDLPGTVVVDLPRGDVTVWAIARSTDDLPTDAREVGLDVTLRGTDGTEVTLRDPGSRIVYGDQADGGVALAAVARGTIEEPGAYRLTAAEALGEVGAPRAGIGPGPTFDMHLPLVAAMFVAFFAGAFAVRTGVRLRSAERAGEAGGPH